MDAATLAIDAFVVLALSLAVYQFGKPKPLPSIPHNKLTWFLGDIPLLTRMLKERGANTYAFEETAIRHGPVSQVVVGPGAGWASRWLGFGQAIVVLSDSQEIQDVLVNRAHEFDRSKSISFLFSGTIPEGMVVLPTNDKLKHHKRYLQMTMTAPYLARMTPGLVELMQELVDLWTVAAKRLPGSPDVAIDAMDDIRLASIDVIAAIAFGGSFKSVKTSLDFLEATPAAGPSARPEVPKLASDLQDLLDVITEGIMFPAPSLLPFLTRNFNKKWRRAIDSIHGNMRTRLNATRTEYAEAAKDGGKALSEADNVLDMILEREREDMGKGVQALTESEILDELTLFALGGSETTATTMQWAVKFLAKHPAVQHKLHAELLDNLPSLAVSAPSYAELSNETNLPYLTAVVYEVLRCARAAPAVARDAKVDTVILGHPIPKGTQVLMPVGMIQQVESDAFRGRTDEAARSATSKRGGRRWGHWEEGDVLKFNPERWLRADGSFDVNAGPWLAFGYGFRACFGQKLALLELRAFLAMVQFNFFFAALPEEINTWKSVETVTNHPVQCFIRPILWENMQKGSWASTVRG
ncbi:cytochrome P450 [Mycena albidolilacea]|uniref:Cytochrome P450 n=1 Tax=Mycena albidolilacea TaxID=1033008 RepID=A0AAD7EWQ8_9AGAR|nr:cytochrome P450 [Mycena albidolilacea]